MAPKTPEGGGGKTRTGVGADGGSGRPALAIIVPGIFAAALVGMAQLPVIHGHDRLFPVVLAGAALLVLWGAVLYAQAVRSGRPLQLERVVRRPHWVQALTQVAVYLYWAYHANTVYGFFPLIVAQVLFAYGVDALVSWSRRDTHSLGFGPFPIIFSINLFLLFRPQAFEWQFVMILVGYLAKDLIRWERDGRSAHIFNPSSFPLGVASLALLATGMTDLTLGSYIAQSQSTAPHMYLMLFLVSIPGQLLFGVARMTVAAVVSMVAISAVYLQLTGTYMFRDAFVTVPVFLGMHLLFTDPSTSPRTESGQLAFGVIYALGVTCFFFLLDGLGLPTYFEKLMPVPIMNLMVRRIDLIARSGVFRKLDPARIGAGLSPSSRNVAYTGVWVGVFTLFSAGRLLGDRNPGQYYPFWRDACADGSARACQYQAFMTYNYCNRGSGWACNEYGIYLADRRYASEAREMFRLSCEDGFAPACENERMAASVGVTWARADPRVQDLPIVLRGSKGPVTEQDPARLMAMACEQGWPLCEDEGMD